MAKSSKASAPEALPYRPCVGQLVINREGKIWVGQRIDAAKAQEGAGTWWQMPQGGIDENEDPRDAALRELYEETAMRTVEIIGETSGWLHYDLPSHLIGKVWGGRYRGQKQRWYALRFNGPDSEIDISARDGHDAEFSHWRWTEKEDLPDLVVPFKKEIYTTVLAQFSHLITPAC